MWAAGVLAVAAWLSSFSWTNPLWTLLEFAKAMETGFSGGFIGAIALIIFGVGCWSFSRSSLVVVILLALPSVLGAAVMIGLGHHLWPRFFFFTMGFAVLVVIRGITVVVLTIAKTLRITAAKVPLYCVKPRNYAAMMSLRRLLQ